MPIFSVRLWRLCASQTRKKSHAQYLLATGQLDNPAELQIAASKYEMSVSLMVQLRNKGLEAYNELMRISL